MDYTLEHGTFCSYSLLLISVLKRNRQKKKPIILQAKKTRYCWVLFTWCWNPAGEHRVAGIILYFVPLHFNLLAPIAVMQITALWRVEHEQGCSESSSEATYLCWDVCIPLFEPVLCQDSWHLCTSFLLWGSLFKANIFVGFRLSFEAVIFWSFLPWGVLDLGESVHELRKNNNKPFKVILEKKHIWKMVAGILIREKFSSYVKLSVYFSRLLFYMFQTEDGKSCL